MKDYEVQFTGLNNGIHTFDFEIGEKFFEYFGESDLVDSEITSGNLRLELSMDKKETMLVFDFKIEGSVKVLCAKCSDEMDVQILSKRQIIGKFSDEETWHEDDIIHIPSSAHKVDLKDLIFQFVLLEVPMRTVHEKDECNPEMLEEIEKRSYYHEEKEDTDPRWDALKNLK